MSNDNDKKREEKPEEKPRPEPPPSRLIKEHRDKEEKT